MGGPTIRVIYAIASDGGDQSMQRAPQISADVETITEWWRSQDYARVPRFTSPRSRVAGRRISCSPACPSRPATSARPTRGSRESWTLSTTSGRIPHTEYLVYYDGPVADSHLCGEGGGSAVGPGVAVVYLQPARESLLPSSRPTLVHAFGALPDTGPAHPVPATRAIHAIRPATSCTPTRRPPSWPYSRSTSGTTTTTRTPAAGSTCRTRPGCATSRRRRPCSP